MKVRITHDTIRIRLNQTEIRQLADGSSIQMETPFAGETKLRSILRPAATETLSASLQPFAIVVDVPRAQLVTWATSDLITLESLQENGAVTIVIEKDFHCLHRDTAEDADTFPNPNLR